MDLRAELRGLCPRKSSVGLKFLRCRISCITLLEPFDVVILRRKGRCHSLVPLI